MRVAMGAWPWPKERAWKRLDIPEFSASCNKALVGSWKQKVNKIALQNSMFVHASSHLLQWIPGKALTSFNILFEQWRQKVIKRLKERQSVKNRRCSPSQINLPLQEKAQKSEGFEWMNLPPQLPCLTLEVLQIWISKRKKEEEKKRFSAG